MRGCIPKITGILLIVFMLLNLTTVAHAEADDGADYAGMVDQIEGFFDKALTLYKEGDVTEARLNAQAAYFEVFENMEGPIRINISARKNFELEEEFVGIRNMIKDRQPAESIEKRINALVADLNAQFDGYKNTLLETAVRRNISQGADYENNNSFSELIGMIRSGRNPEELELRISALIANLENGLPGL